METFNVDNLFKCKSCNKSISLTKDSYKFVGKNGDLICTSCFESKFNNLYCLDCGKEKSTLYKYNNRSLCSDCLLKEVIIDKHIDTLTLYKTFDNEILGDSIELNKLIDTICSKYKIDKVD